MNLVPYIDQSRNRLQEVEAEIAAFDFANGDQKHYQALNREYQQLRRLMESWDAFTGAQQELQDNRQMLETEEDEEFRDVIQNDIDALETRIAALDREIKALILPPHPNEGRNTIVEIRPAAGGDEAGLFAGDLYRMYLRFAETKGWKHEILELSDTPLGGIKGVAFSLQGDEVWGFMRFESGVHRVQRIPVTESGGRIHTSTVTVAVLAEAEDVDIQINNEDLRIDVFRSSGPGGQSVNTTDSAVRITHVPSGLSVASQQEKSQHRNREIAMRILRSRLLEMKQQEEDAKNAAERRSQVGSGERSERIRTYNFPQNRVTDHRYGITLYDLTNILEGQLDELLSEIRGLDAEQRLEDELNAES
jgi:peptide chain release factor 1